MLLLVDTNIVSYFHRGDTRAKRYEPHLMGKQLFVSLLTVAELYKWPLERNWSEQNKQALVQFLKNYVVLPYDDALAWKRAELVSQTCGGRPISFPDSWIALLVRAAAEGLDVNAVVNGLNQLLPLVRFQLLISKAAEICQQVKSLGASLQSAFEKGDNEALSLLRSQHESTLLNLAESVKYAQWQDAIKARQALEQSLPSASQRYTFYQRLLGMSADQITIPDHRIWGNSPQVQHRGVSSSRECDLRRILLYR